MTNSIGALVVAYKAAALALMMDEATFLARALQLPGPPRIERRHLTSVTVRPQDFGFGGLIQTTNLTFSFGDDGKMFYVGRQKGGTRTPDLNDFQSLSGRTSRIDKAEAQTLARRSLQAISFDLATVEATGTNFVKQLYSPHFGLLPLFECIWAVTNHSGTIATVQVDIDGYRAELIGIDLSGRSSGYLKRPVLSVTNRFPDEASLPFKALQKRRTTNDP